jgi:hypothetical protein
MCLVVDAPTHLPSNENAKPWYPQIKRVHSGNHVLLNNEQYAMALSSKRIIGSAQLSGGGGRLEARLEVPRQQRFERLDGGGGR